MFAALWREAGGSLAGQVRRGLTPGQCGDAGQRQLAHPGEVVRDINKYSNNTMARQLFLTLGAEFAQEGDVLRDGEAAVRRWATQRKLACPACSWKTARPVAARAHQRRWPGRAAASRRQLAVCARIHGLAADCRPRRHPAPALCRPAGGSPIQNRLVERCARWPAVKAVDGRRYALVVLINSPRASELTPAMDALVAG